MTPLRDLAAIVATYEAKLHVGNHYRHKKTGDSYMAIGVSLRESDLLPLAQYSPLEDTRVVFSRPLDEFLEKFDLPPLIDRGDP